MVPNDHLAISCDIETTQNLLVGSWVPVSLCCLGGLDGFGMVGCRLKFLMARVIRASVP